MDENNYLYDIYLKQKKEVENLKVKFNKNLINDDDVDKNKNFLYNLVFSIIVLCIIILIAINIHLYVYKSVLLNAILVIFLMIFLIITNVFKIVQPTRMDNDKFYWFKFKKVQS
jgi:Ca2+/Na+ antiporter